MRDEKRAIIFIDDSFYLGRLLNDILSHDLGITVLDVVVNEVEALQWLQENGDAPLDLAVIGDLKNGDAQHVIDEVKQIKPKIKIVGFSYAKQYQGTDEMLSNSPTTFSFARAAVALLGLE